MEDEISVSSNFHICPIPGEITINIFTAANFRESTLFETFRKMCKTPTIIPRIKFAGKEHAIVKSIIYFYVDGYRSEFFAKKLLIRALGEKFALWVSQPDKIFWHLVSPTRIEYKTKPGRCDVMYISAKHNMLETICIAHTL